MKSIAPDTDLPAYLFVLPWSPVHPGGVNQVVLNLAREMQLRRVCRPLVLVNDYTCKRQVWEQCLGIDVVRWYLQPEHSATMLRTRLRQWLWRKRFTPTFRRFCSQHRVAVINVHYATEHVFTLLHLTAALHSPPPVLVSFHGADLSWIADQPPAERARWQRLGTQVRAYVACSQALAQRLRETLGAGVEPAVVHNGLDAGHFVGLAAARATSAAPRRRLLSVGKFEAKKGQDVLLHAHARLRAEFPDLELVLAGASDTRLPALRELAVQLGVADTVHFMPDTPHAEVAGLMRDATVFVLPSRQEPFGIVLLEAGSFALPVVASRVGGIPEIVSDGDTGRLVAPDDPQALAEALSAMLRDPDAAASMGYRLQSIVHTRFTWTRALDQYLALAAPRPFS